MIIGISCSGNLIKIVLYNVIHHKVFFLPAPRKSCGLLSVSSGSAHNQTSFLYANPPRGSGRVSPWPKLLWGMKKSKLFTLTLKLWTKIVLKTLTYRYLGLTTDPPGSGRIRGNPITGVEKKPARDEGAARPAIRPTATIHPPRRAQGGAMCH